MPAALVVDLSAHKYKDTTAANHRQKQDLTIVAQTHVDQGSRDGRECILRQSKADTDGSSHRSSAEHGTNNQSYMPGVSDRLKRIADHMI